MAIDGVIISPLKIIDGELGQVMHCITCASEGFVGFGEAYFSTVNTGVVKGWKRHFEMTLNLAVPVGEVKFVLYDDRSNSPTVGVWQEIVLSPQQYQRLTVPPLVWVAFKGLASPLNMLINVASIPHNPSEQENLPLTHEKFGAYHWT